MIDQSSPEHQDLLDPVIEMADKLIWHSTRVAEPTVQQARAWMQKLMQLPNQDSPAIRAALKNCRSFLISKGSLIESASRNHGQ